MKRRTRGGVKAGLLLLGALLAFHRANAAAFTISGVVTNESGQPLANVDLDFLDTCTGDLAFLVNDKTTATGAFSIVVNEGDYDIRFTPPAASTAAGTEIRGYTVSANASLGSIVLSPGRLVSGTVRSATNAAIAGVDLKFVDAATGTKIWVGKDVTNSSGAYAVRVRPGTYEVEYRPPPSSTFVTGRRSGLVVGAADVGGLVDVLATGLKVDGTVKDSNGTVLKNVDLDFYDSCTGEKIPTANDNTDVQGKYAIYVPAGTYSVHVNPPACRNLASERIPGVQVFANTGIGNTRLLPGVRVSGRVLDDFGAPLANAKLKFYTSLDGSRQGTTRDDTDAAGAFSILLPESTFNVNVEAPVSRDLLVSRLSDVVVAGPTSLGDVSLQPGQALNGFAFGPGGAPIRNVNVNVVDSATRVAVRLAHDSTNADGSFRVVVPPGSYDVQYDPPACSSLAPDDQKGIAVQAPTPLPPKQLVVGAHVTGDVTDDAAIAAPVAAADLDFYLGGTATKAYTPGDRTDSAGAYDVLVKPDVYDVDFKPPAGSRLRPVRRAAVGVPADTVLSPTVLPSGWLVSGTVHAQSTGLPVVDTTVEVRPAAGGAAAWTVHNQTAPDGSFLVAVDPGTWDLQFLPPQATGLAPRWLRSVTVIADIAVGDTALFPLTTPTVDGATPATGSTSGGGSTQISGGGFQPDATVRIGGRPATGVSVLSSTTIVATAAPHPAGIVAIEVENPGALVGSRPASYTYVEPANPVVLSVRRSGSDIVLTWTSTGQPAYTVFRSASPGSFTDASVVGTTNSTAFTDAGGTSAGTLQFYNVD